MAQPAQISTPSCRVYVGNLSWRTRWQDLKDHMKGVGEVVRADVFEDYQGKSKGCGIVEFANAEAAQRAIKELTDTELGERLIFVREDRESGGGGRYGGGGGGGGGGPPRGGYGYYNRGGFYGGGRGGGGYGGGGYGGGGYGGGYGRGGSQFDDYRGGGGGGFGGRGGGYDGGFAPRGGYGGRGGYGPPAGDGRGGYGGRGGLRPGDEGRQIFISNLPWRTGWPDLKDMFRECGEVIRTDVLQFPDGRSRGVATALFATEDDARRAIEMFNDYELDGRRIQVRMDRGPGF